jgi:hypothetical protein
MTQSQWQSVIAIFHLLWSSVGPALKAAAVAELKSLEVAEASQPLLVLILKEAEVLVAAA